MVKYSYELKLQAVLAYLDGKESMRAIAKRFNISKTPLLNWIALYKENGVQGLIPNYTNYDIQFKMDVLNYMSEFGASLTQTAAVYNIPSPSTIHQWQRQVDFSGVDALLPKKKGRPSMKKELNKQPKQAPVEGSTEALQARIKQLEMENEYLKKLNALVQNKEKSPRKTK